jgi:hypothetical protein
MPKVAIVLNEIERSALERLARSERRTMKAQAAAIIRERLIRRRLIPRGIFQTQTTPERTTDH